MRYRPVRPAPEPRPPRVIRPLSLRKKLAFSFVAVTLFLGLLELGARAIEVWAPPMPVDYGLGFDQGSRIFAPVPGEPWMMSTRPEKITSFLDQKFPLHKPAGTLRMAVVGGSSVNYMKDQFPTLARDLERELAPRFQAVEILNAGGLSYGSHRLARVVAELLTYDPDVIVFYEAHNEFEEIQQLQLASIELLGVQKITYKSALARLIRDRLTAMKVARLRREHAARMRKDESGLTRAAPDPLRAHRHAFTPAEIAARMESFRRNMERIADLCAARHVPLLLCTVPSNLYEPYLPEAARTRYLQVRSLIRQGRYEEASRLGRQILRETAGRHQSSDLENGILRAIAKERSLPLADVEADVIRAEPHGLPGETLFYDHCHLNAEGREILREAIERQVVQLFGTPSESPRAPDSQ